jgi:hypothetical protein
VNRPRPPRVEQHMPEERAAEAAETARVDAEQGRTVLVYKIELNSLSRYNEQFVANAVIEAIEAQEWRLEHIALDGKIMLTVFRR